MGLVRALRTASAALWYGDCDARGVPRWNPFLAVRPALDLCLLTWASGVLDALSYVRAGVFTANMTGNTVILGLAMVGPGRSRVFYCLIALGAFALGVVMAGLVLVRWREAGDWTRDLKTGSALELPFVAGLTALWILFPAKGPFVAVAALTALAACALGIQSVAVRRMKLSGVVTTFITGTLTTAILAGIQRKGSGGKSEEAPNSPPALAGMLAIYVGAAVTGGALSMARSAFAAPAAFLPLAVVFLRSLGNWDTVRRER